MRGTGPLQPASASTRGPGRLVRVGQGRVGVGVGGEPRGHRRRPDPQGSRGGYTSEGPKV